jgi:hypothetical protein
MQLHSLTLIRVPAYHTEWRVKESEGYKPDIQNSYTGFKGLTGLSLSNSTHRTGHQLQTAMRERASEGFREILQNFHFWENDCFTTSNPHLDKADKAFRDSFSFVAFVSSKRYDQALMNEDQLRLAKEAYSAAGDVPHAVRRVQNTARFFYDRAYAKAMTLLIDTYLHPNPQKAELKIRPFLKSLAQEDGLFGKLSWPPETDVAGRKRLRTRIEREMHQLFAGDDIRFRRVDLFGTFRPHTYKGLTHPPVLHKPSPGIHVGNLPDVTYVQKPHGFQQAIIKLPLEERVEQADGDPWAHKMDRGRIDLSSDTDNRKLITPPIMTALLGHIPNAKERIILAQNILKYNSDRAIRNYKGTMTQLGEGYLFYQDDASISHIQHFTSPLLNSEYSIPFAYSKETLAEQRDPEEPFPYPVRIGDQYRITPRTMPWHKQIAFGVSEVHRSTINTIGGFFMKVVSASGLWKPEVVTPSDTKSDLTWVYGSIALLVTAGAGALVWKAQESSEAVHSVSAKHAQSNTHLQ